MSLRDIKQQACAPPKGCCAFKSPLGQTTRVSSDLDLPFCASEFSFDGTGVLSSVVGDSMACPPLIFGHLLNRDGVFSGKGSVLLGFPTGGIFEAE